MKDVRDSVRLPPGDDAIAPVTILDADGRVVRIISAADFRRDRPAAPPAFALPRRRRRSETTPAS